MLAGLFTAIAGLICLADRAPLHTLRHLAGDPATAFDTWLDTTASGRLGGPYVYRVLVPLVLSGLAHALPVLSAITWDLILKWLFVTALQLGFFAYLRRFFEFAWSFAGVLLLDVLLDFSLVQIPGPHPVETADVLSTLCLVAAFSLLHADRYAALCLCLFVGTFNRETTWFALPAVLLHEWTHSRRLARSAAASAAVAIPYLGLRLSLHSADWFMRGGVIYNLPVSSTVPLTQVLVANLHVALLLGPLLALGFWRFSAQPLFLRHVAAIAPPFVMVHYLLGIVIEGRIWMPLFPVLIPLALGTLSRAERRKP